MLVIRIIIVLFDKFALVVQFKNLIELKISILILKITITTFELLLIKQRTVLKDYYNITSGNQFTKQPFIQRITTKIIPEMFMQKKQGVYHQNDPDRIPSTKMNITKHKERQFDFNRIGEIDNLLNKNEQIYKNLRKKLQDINQADKNIANNLNVIRPISYGTRERELEAAIQYQRFLNDTGSYYKTLTMENFESSPIQTERMINESLRRKINGQNKSVSIINDESYGNTSINHQTSLRDMNSRLSNSQNFKKSSQIPIITEQPQIIRKSNNPIFSSSQNFINSQSYNNFNDNSSLCFEKENLCYMNKSYEPLVDSLVRMNFGQLGKRKEEIDNIYQQLRKEQEDIERAYQDYKKGLTKMHQASMSTKKEESLVKSPPKRLSPKKSMSKNQSSSEHPSKISTISRMNESNVNIKQSLSLNNSTKTQEAGQNLQDKGRTELSPVKMSIVKYCTQEFDSTDQLNKPQPMTARSHVFVPFNKLYKSPIMQMKNKNTLILARQSKLLPQKTTEQRIVDGKKYKFNQTIETDEQEVIKNVLRQDHNMVAIVGGHQTLKKKLHMSIIAHAIDKILKIVNNQDHNCLTIGFAYQEYIEKSQNSMAKINNSIEINQSTPKKLIILEIQKTTQEIYEAIKRPLLESTAMHKNSSQSPKDKIKVVRFTKISLLSGKDHIWSCHILSANQFSFDFLKNLEVKDIIWSVNPLIKNYDEVSKTLNEATKYNQARIQM